MSAISENTAFLNHVLNTMSHTKDFLSAVDAIPEKTVLEMDCLEIISAQSILIRTLALQVVEVNDLLHKHHIKTS